ncbi:MAG: tetratricopeptide repeat protein [bacterium]
MKYIKLTLMVLLATFIIGVLYADNEPKTYWDRMMQEQSYIQQQRGNRALYFRDYEAALKEFKKAVESNYNDYNAHRMLGITYYWTGQVDKAMEEYKIALEINPKDAQSHMVLGIAYAWGMDMDKAITEFEKVIKYDPARYDAYMNLGSAFQARGELRKSIYYFQQAVKYDKRNPVAHFQLAITYKLLERYTEAISEFKKAIKIFPGYEDAYLELGGIAEKNDLASEALGYYKAAADLKDGDAVAQLKVGLSYLKLNKRMKAIRSFAKALRLTPSGDQKRLALDLAFSGDDSDSSRGREDPLASFEENIKQVSPEEEAEVNFEIRYKEELPLSSVEKMDVVSYGSGKGIRYVLPLIDEDPLERKKKIEQFVDKIRRDLGRMPKSSKMEVEMTIDYKDRDNNLSQASGSSKNKKSDKKRLMYQPRVVGNDLGLWVLGSHWLLLVHETIDMLSKKLNSNSSWEEQLGLAIAYLQAGFAWQALDILNMLKLRMPEEVIINQGLIVAYVELGEWDRVNKELDEILQLEPRNDYAQEIKKWLEDESGAKTNER